MIIGIHCEALIFAHLRRVADKANKENKHNPIKPKQIYNCWNPLCMELQYLHTSL